ncbi:MAG: ferritin-like domain-containing protein, partial [Deltaproteobacteria bacterium]|nr:ferritin-like domain-containing protein [Deltaproteobacteria bacterium]
ALVQLAIDNAVEGCVREAYGAVVAAAQAASASDTQVRATFSAIAREEAEHALLSLDLDAWAGSRLSPRDRRRVAAERDEASMRFAKELEAEPTPGVRSLLGLPDATRAQDLLRAIA